MTKKEKKELALKLRAEIEAKKPPKEKITPEERVKRNNHRRELLDKARNRKGSEPFKPKNKNHWDFEKW